MPLRLVCVDTVLITFAGSWIEDRVDIIIDPRVMNCWINN